jgi:hypothetical protein
MSNSWVKNVPLWYRLFIEKQANNKIGTNMKKKTRKGSEESWPPPENIPAVSESMDNTLFFVKTKDGAKGPFTLSQLRFMWDKGEITASMKPGF